MEPISVILAALGAGADCCLLLRIQRKKALRMLTMG